MNTLAIAAVLQGEEFTLSDSDTVISNLSVASYNNIVASLGAHNMLSEPIYEQGQGQGQGRDRKIVAHNVTIFALRIRNGTTPRPTSNQIDAAILAVGAAIARLELARQVEIATDRANAVARIGDRLAALIDSSILAAHPAVSPVNIQSNGEWLIGTITDSDLAAEVSVIRNS